MDNRLQIAQWRRELANKNKELAAAEVKAKNNVKKGNMTSLPISAATAVRIKHEIAKLESDIARLEGINNHAKLGAATATAAALTARAAALLPPGGAGSGSASSGSASSSAAPIVAITAPTSRFFDEHMAAAFREHLNDRENPDKARKYMQYVIANSTRPKRFKGSKLEETTFANHEEYQTYLKGMQATAAAELKPNPLPTHAVRGGRSRRLKSKRNKRTRRHVR